ncbi:Na(+)/H(+) exchange regulatory cofactor NHE-RF2 [Rhipicephalus microplus]|uniref:Na(+)/H(+) exchange regulatory cofactor NHE-RF2 n=1 Tax=Rhipicephalus microplus TaxID=6941 RepID=UPI001888F1F6|nr:Na(+)/H(+) exchange regulatory cofactor NHE-RF2-like [Rhipicephalus microplus]
MSTTPDALPAEAPAPRLCHLIKISTFDGYGFNLHAEKSRPGQFIGKVDSGSPAELAGMLEGDRIVEVNGVNIASESHKQVVERIRAVPNETRLLVVDSATDAWYTEHKLVPRSTQDNVRYIRTPTTGDDSDDVVDGGVQPQANGHHAASETATEEQQPSASLPSAKDEPEEPEKTLTADGEAAADLPDDAPQPRLCHMTKWRDFEGYGFNLHAEKDRRGQYVGKIDEGSPAEYAGLREGDRIVEVNGVNVQQEAHRDIVERIRAVPDETRLLVLTADGEQWYRDRDIQVHGNQANVLRLRNPELNPATNGESRGDGAMAAAADGSECSQEDEAAQSAPTPVLRRQSDLDGKEDTEEEESRSSESEPVPAKTEVSAREEPNGTGDKAAEGPVTGLTQVDSGSESKPAPGTEPAPAEPANAMSNGSLNMLNMSASEMRQLLAQRKKHDPKKIQMDLKKKYELIEQM